MYLHTFDVNCTERTGWTKVLASTATDTDLGVDSRVFLAIFLLDHQDRADRTMASTIAASYAIGAHYAVLLIEYRITDLDGALLLN